jgi:endonuclease-8|tara:strand:- start:81822 stop:82733 length:912 start_codon:yes stop_codon:yes gene_type:complete
MLGRESAHSCLHRSAKTHLDRQTLYFSDVPEGPEIRRAADRLGKALIGRTIEHAKLPYGTFIGREHLIQGQTVIDVTSRAKAMLIRFENGWTMYSHNQLYGRWTVNLVTTKNTMRRTLRAELCTEKHAVRLWSATDIDLIPTIEEPLHAFLARLGPDVLEAEVDSEVLYNQLVSKKCFRKKGATLMLDQRSFAGLGNYLRSEILFSAGVHPDDRPCDLPEERLRAWAEAIKNVTVQAYQTGGVTVPKSVAEAGKSRGEPRRTWRHFAFCRNERPCLKCATLIVRLRYGGRRLDHCPRCQTTHR